MRQDVFKLRRGILLGIALLVPFLGAARPALAGQYAYLQSPSTCSEAMCQACANSQSCSDCVAFEMEDVVFFMEGLSPYEDTEIISLALPEALLTNLYAVEYCVGETLEGPSTTPTPTPEETPVIPMPPTPTPEETPVIPMPPTPTPEETPVIPMPPTPTPEETPVMSMPPTPTPDQTPVFSMMMTPEPTPESTPIILQTWTDYMSGWWSWTWSWYY